MPSIPTSARIIQYGTHVENTYAALGIREPLEPPQAQQVYQLLDSHLHASALVLRCELKEDTPDTSYPHNLILLHGFTGRITEVAFLIEAFMFTLKEKATIDPRHYDLNDTVGLFSR